MIKLEYKKFSFFYGIRIHHNAYNSKPFIVFWACRNSKQKYLKFIKYLMNGNCEIKIYNKKVIRRP